MRKCPDCGSGNIEKEIIRGHRTGDLVCKDCGSSGMPKDFDALDEKDSYKEILKFISSIEINEYIKEAIQELNKEVMEKFGIAKCTLANYRSKGKLSYSKFGGSVVYKVSDIEEFLERNRIKKIS